MENRKSRAYFFHCGGHQLMVNVNKTSIDNVDVDVLGLFTSDTDRACLGGSLRRRVNAMEKLKS